MYICAIIEIQIFTRLRAIRKKNTKYLVIFILKLLLNYEKVLLGFYTIFYQLICVSNEKITQ